MVKLDFAKIDGFDWDKGNKEKNWEKHKVQFNECEEVFFNKPLLIDKNIKHSNVEIRYRVLGQTNNKKTLFMSFTIRKKKIRVISARPQSRKERMKYEKAKTLTGI